MASKNPPVKNAAYTFRLALFAQSDNQIKTTPTIAAGDFKVSVDGGALANPTTLPSESPASSGAVLITLTAAEMNGDEIFIRWLDASGDEWHSGAIVLHTIAAGKQFDDLSTLTTAQVNTEADTALADYDPPTKAELDAGLAALNDLSTTEVEDAVWDAVIANHLTAGSTGEALDDAQGVSSPAAIADAVWDEAIADHLGAGSTGLKLNASGGGTTFPAGAIEFTYTVTNSVSGLPLPGVDVWITTDVAGTDVVWRGTTDSFGVARDVNDDLPWLDPGTWQIFRNLAGFIFQNPDEEIVS